MRSLIKIITVTMLLVGLFALLTVSTVAAKEQYQFVFISHGSAGDPFHSVIKQGMQDAAKQLGVKAEMIFCEGDVARQVNALETAIAGKPDGIAISLTDEKAFDAGVKNAIQKGIPVIAFNMDDPTPNARLAYVGQDMETSGYAIGKEIAKYLKKGDHVVIPEEVPGMLYAVLRSKGIKQALKEIGATWEELDAGYERALTTSRISAYLMGHPETKAIIGVGGLTTEVAGQVVKDLNLTGKVLVGGFDVLPSTLGAIEKGITKAVVDQQPYLQGYLSVVQLYLIAMGKFSAIDMDTGRAIVNSENVSEVKALVSKRIR